MSLRTGKPFNARFPEALHRLIKAMATTAAERAGGQANMNKVLIELLYDQTKDKLTPEEQKSVELFISKL